MKIDKSIKEGRENLEKLIRHGIDQSPAGKEFLEHIEKHKADFVSAEAPIIRQLQENGTSADSIEELLHVKKIPRDVIDLLMPWLEKIEYQGVLVTIVRILSKSTAPYDGRPLARLFETDKAEDIRWDIANTISESKALYIDDWIFDTLQHAEYGKCREMLCDAVARYLPQDRAREALYNVFDQLPGHAARGFRIAGIEEDIPFLEEKLKIKDQWHNWVGKGIEKAIRAIQRRANRAQKKKKK